MKQTIGSHEDADGLRTEKETGVLYQVGGHSSLATVSSTARMWAARRG